jgi:hypothetical protein
LICKCYPDLKQFKLGMKKESTAVLHLKNKEPKKVFDLAGKVTTGLTENATTFVDPDPSIESISTENTKLGNLINSKDGSKQKNQAISEQAVVVYNLLKSATAYVSKVAAGDRSIILLSGFDCSDDPVTHGIPGKAVIKRVEDGSSVCSVKIYADKLDGADRYKVEITTTPNDASSWKTVLDPASLRNLEFGGQVRGQEIYIRLTGGNTHGWGIPSEYVIFIPR